MVEKVKLSNDDWDALFPGTEFKLFSKTKLVLQPLSLQGLNSIIKTVTALQKDLSALNVESFEDFTSKPDLMIKVVSLIVEKAPGILSEMSSLDPDDVSRLPLDKAVELFTAALEVNLNSQESLTKNFRALGARLSRLVQTDTVAAKALNTEA